MTEIVNSCGFTAVDGVLMDIGVSSYQLDTLKEDFPIIMMPLLT